MIDVSVLRSYQPREAVGTECPALHHFPHDIKTSGAKETSHKQLLKRCSMMKTQSAPLSNEDTGILFSETEPASKDGLLPLITLSSG